MRSSWADIQEADENERGVRQEGWTHWKTHVYSSANKRERFRKRVRKAVADGDSRLLWKLLKGQDPNIWLRDRNECAAATDDKKMPSSAANVAVNSQSYLTETAGRYGKSTNDTRLTSAPFTTATDGLPANKAELLQDDVCDLFVRFLPKNLAEEFDQKACILRTACAFQGAVSTVLDFPLHNVSLAYRAVRSVVGNEVAEPARRLARAANKARHSPLQNCEFSLNLGSEMAVIADLLTSCWDDFRRLGDKLRLGTSDCIEECPGDRILLAELPDCSRSQDDGSTAAVTEGTSQMVHTAEVTVLSDCRSVCEATDGTDHCVDECKADDERCGEDASLPQLGGGNGADSEWTLKQEITAEVHCFVNE